MLKRHIKSFQLLFKRLNIDCENFVGQLSHKNSVKCYWLIKDYKRFIKINERRLFK